MIEVVYLLVGSSGEWEDHHKWLVGAYVSETDASAAAEIAKREALAARAACDRDEPWEAVKGRLTVDPNADVEQPSHYHVTEVEVAAGIETRRAATTKIDAVHESPARKGTPK